MKLAIIEDTLVRAPSLMQHFTNRRWLRMIVVAMMVMVMVMIESLFPLEHWCHPKNYTNNSNQSRATFKVPPDARAPGYLSVGEPSSITG